MLELGASVVVEDIDVQFALLRQAGKSEIAAPHVAGGGVVGVGAVQQVELGVQRIANEKLDDELASLDLRLESLQTGLVLVAGGAGGQLLPELFCCLPAQPPSLLGIHEIVAAQQAERRTQLVVRQPLHAN